MINTHPCRYCTQETGRGIYCKSTCTIYIEFNNSQISTINKRACYKHQQEILDKCGNFMGYTFLPSGKVRGFNVVLSRI